MLIAVAAGIAPLVLTLAGTLVARAIERAREKSRHASILVELGPPAVAAHVLGAAKNQVVTVEGKLVALGDAPSSGTLASFHPYGTSFLDEMNLYAVTASTAPQGFAVELDGGAGRAILDGRAQVLTGAIETEHGTPLEQATALEAAPLATAKVKKRVGQFRILRPGDRVRARGAVEPAPDDDALYRNKSNVVRMTPASVEGNIGEPMISVAATSSRRQRTSQRQLLPAIGGALVIGTVLAIGVVRVEPRAALPSRPVVPAATAKPVEPPCRAVVRTKTTRYESEPAKGCADPYARALAAYTTGDFEAASAGFAQAATAEPALVPSLAEVEAHLFVHAFDRAAATVRRMVAQFYPGPSTAEKRLLECVLAVIEDRAKKPRAGGPYFVQVCSTRPFNKVARELDSEGDYGGQDDWPRATYRRDARYEAVGDPYTSVVSTRARLLARPVALERSLLDRLIVPRDKVAEVFPIEAVNLSPLLATYAAELTLFYAYAGFPERSAPYWPFLDRVATMVEQSRTFYEARVHDAVEKKRITEDEDHLTFVMAVAGAAALYSGDTARMQRYSKLSEPYTGQATRQMAKLIQPKSTWEEPEVDRTWPESKQVFDAALEQNAAEIARVLGELRSTGRNTLPRAMPRLASADRAPLERWFHSDVYPAACPTCGASTFLGDLSDRRAIARLLGDTNEHTRLRDSAERFTTALTDPVIGFELDELETFFSKRK